MEEVLAEDLASSSPQINSRMNLEIAEVVAVVAVEALFLGKREVKLKIRAEKINLCKSYNNS